MNAKRDMFGAVMLRVGADVVDLHASDAILVRINHDPIDSDTLFKMMRDDKTLSETKGFENSPIKIGEYTERDERVFQYANLLRSPVSAGTGSWFIRRTEIQHE